MGDINGKSTDFANGYAQIRIVPTIDINDPNTWTLTGSNAQFIASYNTPETNGIMTLDPPTGMVIKSDSTTINTVDLHSKYISLRSDQTGIFQNKKCIRVTKTGYYKITFSYQIL